jgi:hypothetical protein
LVDPRDHQKVVQKVLPWAAQWVHQWVAWAPKMVVQWVDQRAHLLVHQKALLWVVLKAPPKVVQWEPHH